MTDNTTERRDSGESQDRAVDVAGPELARIVFGWDGPMWRYRCPWGPWMQGEPTDLERERDKAELNGSMDRGEGMP